MVEFSKKTSQAPSSYPRAPFLMYHCGGMEDDVADSDIEMVRLLHSDLIAWEEAMIAQPDLDRDAILGAVRALAETCEALLIYRNIAGRLRPSPGGGWRLDSASR